MVQSLKHKTKSYIHFMGYNMQNIIFAALFITQNQADILHVTLVGKGIFDLADP